MIILVFLYAQVNTERAIRHAIQDRLPIVVVINKVNLNPAVLNSNFQILL